MPKISALGITVEVVLGDTVDPEDFASAWSRCITTAPSTSGCVSVGPAGGMVSLTQSITRELIDQRRGTLLMLHAGAVSHPETGASVAYVAVNADTGKMVWYQQLVHHDLWDYDLSAAPALVESVRNGRRIPAVAQITGESVTGPPGFTARA